jgi:hypothetical protein
MHIVMRQLLKRRVEGGRQGTNGLRWERDMTRICSTGQRNFDALDVSQKGQTTPQLQKDLRD